MKEDNYLLGQIEDKISACDNKYIMTNTGFLDSHQQSVARIFCKKNHIPVYEIKFGRGSGGAGSGNLPPVRTSFYGGYEDAERVILINMPDYFDLERDNPLCIIRAEKAPGSRELTHRDYLGALMGLGIDRSVVGDILVHDRGADLFVLADMADFILMNFLRAGRKRITLDRVPLTDFQPPVVQEVEREGSVASLRLDAVAALIFGMSRAQMQEQIAKGLVFVNQLQCLKNEAALAPGDRITVRGLGRARIVALGGVSRKGRQFVRYAKNV